MYFDEDKEDLREEFLGFAVYVCASTTGDALSEAFIAKDEWTKL